LQNKYVGTGHPDTSKFEWLVNHHRDSLASHIGHYDMLSYFAVASNESIGRTKMELIEKMMSPVGPPPAQTQEDGNE